MLVNPGGPGGSGLTVGARRVRARTAPARPTTGSASTRAASAPACPRCRCDGDYFGLRPARRTCPCTPSTRERPGSTRSKGYAEACAARRRRAARPHEDHRLGRTTWSSIRDRARREQINFYGFSYGTYLGQVYAHAVPRPGAPHGARRQRRPADGLVPGQPRPGRRVRHATSSICFDWLAKHDDVYHLGNDRPRRSSGSATRELNKLRAHARPAARSGRTSGPTSSSTPATTSTAGPTSADAFAGWVNDGDYRR